MDEEILVKIREMLKELGWPDEVINSYCEECVHSEESISAE